MSKAKTYDDIGDMYDAAIMRLIKARDVDACVIVSKAGEAKGTYTLSYWTPSDACPDRDGDIFRIEYPRGWEENIDWAKWDNEQDCWVDEEGEKYDEMRCIEILLDSNMFDVEFSYLQKAAYYAG